MESLKKLVNDFRIISKRIEIEYAVISDKSARIDTHNKLKDSGVETNLSEYGVIQRDICSELDHQGVGHNQAPNYINPASAILAAATHPYKSLSNAVNDYVSNLQYNS